MPRIVELSVEQVSLEDAQHICEAMLQDGHGRLLAAMLGVNFPFRQRIPALVEAMLTLRQNGTMIMVCEVSWDSGSMNDHPQLDAALQNMNPRAELRVSTCWMP